MRSVTVTDEVRDYAAERGSWAPDGVVRAYPRKRTTMTPTLRTPSSIGPRRGTPVWTHRTGLANAVVDRICGVFVRLALPILAMHLAGTFSTFVLAPQLMFSAGDPLLLTANGEFVAKNGGLNRA